MTEDLRPLWPHQERALLALRAALASGRRRPMLQAPTGFGKTLTAAHIIARALGKDKRVAFTVPSINLVDQTVAAFEAEGIHCLGVLQGAHPRTDREAPVQSLQRANADAPDAAGGRSCSRRRGPRPVPRHPALDAGLPQPPVPRVVGDAMDEGLRQILRPPDRCRDHGRSHRRRLSLAVHRLCAEQSGPVFRLDRRRRLQGRRALGGHGSPDDHRRYRGRVAQARRG